MTKDKFDELSKDLIVRYDPFFENGKRVNILYIRKYSILEKHDDELVFYGVYRNLRELSDRFKEALAAYAIPYTN